MDIIYFIFYSLLWFATLIYYYNKRRSVDIGFMIIILTFFCSIFSVIVLTNDSYYKKYSQIGLSIFPLLYLYLVSLLSYSPLLLYNCKIKKELRVYNFLVMDILCLIFIICMILKIPSDLSHLSENLVLLMVDEDAGSTIYSESLRESSSNTGVGVISSLSTVIVNATSEILIFIFFINLIYRRKKILNSLLFLVLLFVPISGIANGQRTAFVLFFLALISTYFLCKSFLKSKLNKRIKNCLIIIVVLCSIPFIALTVSRFGESENGTLMSVFNYGGQSNLNFDAYAFDNNGIRYGDRIFPLFKKIVGINGVPSDFWERRMKYSHLKINDEVYVGYIGDVVLDFGPIVTFIIFLIITIITLGLTQSKGKYLNINQLLVLQLLSVLICQGCFYLYPFADTAGLKIIMYILFYLALLVPIGKNRRRRVEDIIYNEKVCRI